MRIAVDEWCFHNSLALKRMTMEDMIRSAGEMGAEGIGFDYFMTPRELRDEPGRVKSLLAEFDLELVFGFGMPFALPELLFRVVEDRKDEMFDLAHEFNVKILRVVGGVILPNPIHKSFHISFGRDNEIRRVAKNLNRFAKDAAMEGLAVALENHSDYTADEMLRILDLANHENLKITLDTGNAAFLNEDPVETVEKLAPHAIYTHIKDMKKTAMTCMSAPLGEGEIDIPAIIGILKARNYEGLYSIEVDLPVWKAREETESLRKSIEYLKALDA